MFQYVFTNFDKRDEVLYFISSIWSSRGKLTQTDDTSQKNTKAKTNAKDVSLDLTEEDWNLILGGSQEVKCSKDDYIVKEGEGFFGLVQLTRGAGKIQREKSGEVLRLIKSKDDGIFGEISFFQGGNASASIIATQDNTVFNVIAGPFLCILFQYYPSIEGRFYHYISCILAKRAALRYKQIDCREKEDKS
eukprot:TRINITY_DN5215_c0_g1_i1.p3 TRINITY_DN5215_c0_g1~~TRINITY_DN5215_c0_g1_i1.p3  ORF type:complete len:191 (-),score=34.36 TRINITY_DN5215_c0_g1_i1:27-599(-)